MDDFKYETIQDIKESLKYKELYEAICNTAKEAKELKIYDSIRFYIWYCEQLEKCKEYMINFKEWFNREYISQLVDVKDIATGDKNIFEFKNLEETK